MTSPTTTGLRTALRRPGLVFLLWTWHTALALIVAVPAWMWLTQLTGPAPETDVLLDQVQLGALFDLLQSSGGVPASLPATVAGLMGLAALSNAFLSGGLIAVLLEPAGRGRLLGSFFHGAGRFFVRSLFLLLLAGVLLAAAGGAVAVLGGAALDALLSRAGEPGALASGLILFATVGAIAGLSQLVLDYARILLVRDDARSVPRSWLAGAVFVLRQPFAAVTPGVAYGAAIGAILLLAAAPGVSGSARAWTVIVLATLAQQALLLVRVMLRVAMVGTEAATIERYSRNLLPT